MYNVQLNKCIMCNAQCPKIYNHSSSHSSTKIMYIRMYTHAFVPVRIEACDEPYRAIKYVLTASYEHIDGRV